MKILLVEDDPEMAEFISIAFNIGWPKTELLATHQGGQGVELVETKSPDLVILDLGLPDMSGFEVIKQIRAFSEVPIIIETVRSTEADIVKGLDLGADEYIRKPFGQLELLAKVKAVLRRRYLIDDSGTVSIGPIQLNPATGKLFIDKRAIDVTRNEVAIMHCLMARHGQVVSHAELSEAIWGDSAFVAADNIRVYIRRLRRKIESNSEHPSLIVSRPGSGYLLQIQR